VLNEFNETYAKPIMIIAFGFVGTVVLTKLSLRILAPIAYILTL
jgi:hypothetical protein